MFDDPALNTLLCWTLLTKPSEKDAHQENSAGLSNCRELESFIIDWGECLLQDSFEEANSSKEKADKEAARLVISPSGANATAAAARYQYTAAACSASLAALCAGCAAAAVGGQEQLNVKLKRCVSFRTGFF